MRLFISSTPTPNSIHALTRIQEQIQQAQLFDATYVKPENFHVTLLFLGTVAPEKLDQVLRTFSTFATLEYHKFSITLAHIELHQAILWARLDSPELVQAAQDLARIFGRPAQPFTGHITLARIKKIHVPTFLIQELLITLSKSTLSWITTSIELQQSVLTPQGPVYTILARSILY
jgi:RNA 2',3'-cyclic 3'-phosphodiesterase